VLQTLPPSTPGIPLYLLMTALGASCWQFACVCVCNMARPLNWHVLQGIRIVLNDGAAHAVDSNEMAFRLAAIGGFRQAYAQANPAVLEPLMKVEVTVPVEFQGAVMGDLNRRKGMILDSSQEADDAVIQAQVPLNSMFGYSTVLRSNTQGKGEFSMEYSHHAPVTKDEQEALCKAKLQAK